MLRNVLIAYSERINLWHNELWKGDKGRLSHQFRIINFVGISRGTVAGLKLAATLACATNCVPAFCLHVALLICSQLAINAFHPFHCGSFQFSSFISPPSKSLIRNHRDAQEWSHTNSSFIPVNPTEANREATWRLSWAASLVITQVQWWNIKSQCEINIIVFHGYYPNHLKWKCHRLSNWNSSTKCSFFVNWLASSVLQHNANTARYVIKMSRLNSPLIPLEKTPSARVAFSWLQSSFGYHAQRL